MRIQLLTIYLLMFSIAIHGNSLGGFQAANVSPQQSDAASQDEDLDNWDPDGTGDVDEDIIIMDDDDTNDDEGVTSSSPSTQ